MSWSGHVADEVFALRSSMSAQVGDNDLAMGTSDLSTVAVAEAAALANANNFAITHVDQRFFGVNASRGFRVAYNLGGTFGSTFAALEASLPSNPNSNKAMMING